MAGLKNPIGDPRISLRTFEVYLFWLAGFAVSNTPQCYNDNIFSAKNRRSVKKKVKLTRSVFAYKNQF